MKRNTQSLKFAMITMLLLFLYNLRLHSQELTVIKGVITSETGSYLPGVTINVKGSARSALSKEDGSYSIISNTPFGILVFSAKGYLDKELTFDSKTDILNVSLTIENLEMDPIVVVGYGTMRKSDLTGAVASVSSKDLKAVPLTNLAQGIQGRAPGVMVRQTDAAPGGSVSIRVRGGNSITAGNDVLYVVDGFVGVDNINNINPQDIESINILKDASATAIYGARASNGVVLVTTKRGKTGRTVVDVDGYIGTQSFVNRLNLMNSEQYLSFLKQARGANTSNEELTEDWRLKGNENVDTDWQDAILRNAVIQNYSLRFSGGTEKTRYMVSGEYFDQEGIVLGSGFKRLALRSNLDFAVNRKINVGLNLAVSNGNQSTSNPLFAVGQAPPTLPLDYTGINPYDAERKRFVNPYIEATNNFNENKRLKLLGNIVGSYQITPELMLRSTLGLDMTYRVSNSYANKNTGSGMLLEGRLSGSASATRGQYTDILNENTLTFNKAFNSNNLLNIVAGFTLQALENESLSVSDKNFEIDELSYFNIGKSDPARDQLNAGMSYSNEGLVSYLGRVNYTFKNRYLLTVSSRIDGSSKFGANNRYGFFPSGALAWRVSSEPFMENVRWVNNFKLRTSWGLTGNQGISPYSKQATVSASQTAFGTSYRQSSLANPDLKWETTHQLDLGIDLEVLNRKLSFTADYYFKRTRDLLFTRALSGSTGFGSNLENFGEIQNKGLELALGYRNTFGGLSWNSSLNYSFNRSKIIDLPVDRVFSNGLILLEGQPVGLFYGLLNDGVIFPEDLEGLYTSTLRSQRAGELKFVDIDGNGVLDGDKDRTIIGNPNPKFIYGWSNTLGYKNFELSFFIQGVYGNDIYYSNYEFMDLLGTRGRNVFADLADPVKVYPSPGAIYPQIGYAIEDAANSSQIKDGSYLRFKNITLGYNLPQSIASNIKVRNARVYISANNILTFTKYFGLDPEISGSGTLLNGYDNGSSYPASKSILIGINLSL
ncbi:SusC/RagA family TonB-linked outer membrane protein [Niabella aquatica]